MARKNIKEITFNNIDEALSVLNAQDKGRYYVCKCPECQRNEAYIYKNNMKYIQCNRLNNCGEQFKIIYKDKNKVIDLKERELQKVYPELTKKQAIALDWLNRSIAHIRDYFPSPTLENGYRGLSSETTKGFIVDFHNERVMSLMFKKIHPLINKDYSKNEFMCKRNLIFPIYGDDGKVERILLRSSIKPNIEPKEIELIVNPSKETRDFFVSNLENAETIVISEALLDALSFKEIDKDIGFIALTGSNKTRNVKKFIDANKELLKNKQVILAPDDDLAGWKVNVDLIPVLEKHEIDYRIFPFPRTIGDANEYLTKGKPYFVNELERVKSSFNSKERNLINVRRDNQIIAFCESKIDAISLKSINCDIGVVALENPTDIPEFIIENEEFIRGKKVCLVSAKGEKIEKVDNLLEVLGIEYDYFHPHLETVYQSIMQDRKRLTTAFENKLSLMTKKDFICNQKVIGIEK